MPELEPTASCEATSPEIAHGQTDETSRDLILSWDDVAAMAARFSSPKNGPCTHKTHKPTGPSRYSQW